MTVALPPRLADAIREQLTGGHQYPTPGDLAKALDRRIRQTPALDLIDQAIIDCLNTPDGRLILTMSPQEGKSSRAAIATPIWALHRNPDLRVAVASYAQGLANRNGRAIRNTIAANPQLGMRIADDNGAASEWTLAGHEGGVLSVGRGAGITGRPVDCVSGNTHIECEYGVVTAEEAHRIGIQWIRAYDHETGRAGWHHVEASRRIERRPIVEVVTESGRVLTCTPDHRVYSGRGYVAAGSLVPGDALTRLVVDDRVSLRVGVAGAEDGRPQSDPARSGTLLLNGVHGGGLLDGQPAEVLPVRPADPAGTSHHVLGGVREAAEGRGEAVAGLPSVWDVVHAEVVAHNVLQPHVRQHGTLSTHDRPRQLALQDGHELREVVQGYASADHDPRFSRVRGVQSNPVGDVHARRSHGDALGAGGASHRRGRAGQPGRELGAAVPQMPHDASQVTTDSVRLVREVRGEGVAVYDFQVEGARNFFANGILVHNCLIIDDPIKDRAEADSETIRNNCWDWWTDSLSTRLSPGASVILMMTRWHEADLAGLLQKAEDGHLWRVLNIPAQCEKPDTDPLGRKAGEFMVSARGRTQRQWEAIKVRVGSRTWNALYQGRPAPAEGGMIKRDWWRYYEQPLWVELDSGARRALGMDQVLLSADLTFKGTEQSDYVAIGVWGKRGPDAFLLDQDRGHYDFPTTLLRLEAMAARWPDATLKIVEDKANGPAALAMLRQKLSGLVAEIPQGSKVARTAAVSPLIEAGNVHLPHPSLCPWVDDFVEEFAGFPNGAHDDQVDQTTQALNRLLLQPLLTEQGDEWTPLADEYQIINY